MKIHGFLMLCSYSVCLFSLGDHARFGVMAFEGWLLTNFSSLLSLVRSMTN